MYCDGDNYYSCATATQMEHNHLVQEEDMRSDENDNESVHVHDEAEILEEENDGEQEGVRASHAEIYASESMNHNEMEMEA